MILPRMLVALSLVLPGVAFAHGVDDNGSSDLLGPERLLRFDYANDYFTTTIPRSSVRL